MRCALGQDTHLKPISYTQIILSKLLVAEIEDHNSKLLLPFDSQAQLDKVFLMDENVSVGLIYFTENLYYV